MAEARFSERNKAHFDSVAATYYNGTEKASLRLREEIRSRRAWLGIDLLDEVEGDERKVLRLLDYACGPGTMSCALWPYVTQTLGIDVSNEMVKAYNDRARNEGLSPDEMFAASGDLLDPKSPSPSEFRDEKWFNFDLVVVGLGFHHFEDPLLAAARLAERLSPGGVLLIVDFLPHAHPQGLVVSGGDHSQGHSHAHHHAAHDRPTEWTTEDMKKVMATVAHFGFAEETMKETFEKAGVGKEFGFEVIAKDLEISFHGLTTSRDVFMAKGTKKAQG